MPSLFGKKQNKRKDYKPPQSTVRATSADHFVCRGIHDEAFPHSTYGGNYCCRCYPTEERDASQARWEWWDGYRWRLASEWQQPPAAVAATAAPALGYDGNTLRYTSSPYDSSRGSHGAPAPQPSTNTSSRAVVSPLTGGGPHGPLPSAYVISPYTPSPPAASQTYTATVTTQATIIKVSDTRTTPDNSAVYGLSFAVAPGPSLQDVLSPGRYAIQPSNAGFTVFGHNAQQASPSGTEVLQLLAVWDPQRCNEVVDGLKAHLRSQGWYSLPAIANAGSTGRQTLYFSRNNHN